MTSTSFPAPGSATVGAPPALSRPLVPADGDPFVARVADTEAVSAAAPADRTIHSRSLSPERPGVDPARVGLLVGTGLALAALVVELSTRRPA